MLDLNIWSQNVKNNKGHANIKNISIMRLQYQVILKKEKEKANSLDSDI